MKRDTRKTKIIATIGPATASFEQLEALFLAGVNAFRLNFSHSSHDVHLKIIEWTQQLNDKHQSNVSLIADLQGPKLRVGEVENNAIELIKGATIKVTTRPVLGTAELIDVTYPALARDVKAGEQILIDDGKISLEVVESNGEDLVTCKVVDGGILSSRKGFNLPHTRITVPSMTEKDRTDLKFILSQPINWVALSFVRRAKDILELKEIIQQNNAQTKVIAKIEKPEAIKNIESIIRATDAVMIARGDLGVEVPMEEMALVQKSIIRKCIEHARPVIIATQVMESMMEMPRPTRAEITDVANGVLDGADAIMLSGETSVGKFPVKVIETIDKIVRRTEMEPAIYNKNLLPRKDSPTFLSDAICYNACRIAEDISAVCINAMTYSGYTGFMLASYRPRASVYVFTSNRFLLNTMSIVWGTSSFFYDSFESTDESIKDVIRKLKEMGLLEVGDVVINTGSMPIKGRGRTNMIKFTQVS